MVEHPLDEVPRHKHLFGKNIQKLVVDCQVFLHAKFWHLLQSSVDELYMATPPYISLDEDLNRFVECGLGFGLTGHQLKQVIQGGQRLVPHLVMLIGQVCRDWWPLCMSRAAVKTP